MESSRISINLSDLTVHIRYDIYVRHFVGFKRIERGNCQVEITA